MSTGLHRKRIPNETFRDRKTAIFGIQLVPFPDLIEEVKPKMSRIDQNAFKLAELKQAQSYVKRMIGERDDGEAYLPLYERLTLEVEALASKESAIDRIRREVREEKALLASS